MTAQTEAAAAMLITALAEEGRAIQEAMASLHALLGLSDAIAPPVKAKAATAKKTAPAPTKAAEKPSKRTDDAFDQVMSVLTGVSQSARDISVKSGLGLSTVQRHLQAGVKSGRIVAVGSTTDRAYFKSGAPKAKKPALDEDVETVWNGVSERKGTAPSLHDMGRG